MNEREYGKSFVEDIKLDRYALHLECEVQPSLMQFYSEELAKVKTEKDNAEQRLKFLMADKELQYRSNPPPDLKITEAVIASLVATNPEVVAAQNELNAAKSNVYTYDAAVNSLSDKSSMLKLLTQLFSTGYYSVAQ